MKSTIVIATLDAIHSLQVQLDMIEGEKNNEIANLIGAELQAKIDLALEVHADRAKAISDKLAELTDRVKTDVLAKGESIKSTYIHAIYTKPRVSWDTKGLEGYSVAHPEVSAFRSIGLPSVSFRRL